MTKLLKILPFLIVFLSLTMGAAASHAQVPGPKRPDRRL